MLARGTTAVVVVINALESPTIGGPILVDCAAVTFSEKLAPAIDVGQGFLNHALSGRFNHHIGGEGPEAGVFGGFQQYSVVMPVLPAAVGGLAEATRTLANDRNAESSHGNGIITVSCAAAGRCAVPACFVRQAPVQEAQAPALIFFAPVAPNQAAELVRRLAAPRPLLTRRASAEWPLIAVAVLFRSDQRWWAWRWRRPS